jgi:hypothetical protein
MKPRNKFVWKAPHHLYIGLVFILFGWLMDPYEIYRLLVNPFFIFGGLLVIDDVIEHTITYDSPVRLFADSFLYPILRKLNKKLF